MRSKLFELSTATTISLGGVDVPLFGLGLLLAAWVLFAALWLASRWWRYGVQGVVVGDLVPLAIVAGLIGFAPRLTPSIPVYGYGFMLFLGFLSATWLASRRLEKQGADPNIAWDVAMWIFVGGIAGARLFFIAQYHNQFFAAGRSVSETLFRMINLQDGGLVFYGGAILGAVGFAIFCRVRHLSALALGDLLITSVFIGMAFGRLGCLLNGCCYGDYCELPWAITFPVDSVPFKAQQMQGFLLGGEAGSLPVHPTQVYSALNAFCLALLTLAYHPFRRFNGEVLALGWIAYPVSRFLVEFLRGDELGQLGTIFTISQYVSAVLFLLGILFYGITMSRKARSPSLVQLAT
jgi:phosphatidylglycerol:prolipoprotein diacylglycerol transferase